MFLSLPEELLAKVMASAAGLPALGRLACTCQRLRHLAVEEAIWRHRYQGRWRNTPKKLDVGWLEDYTRRHKKDVRATYLVNQLAHPTSTNLRMLAWGGLLRLGCEVWDKLESLAWEGSPAQRSEATKAMVAINRRTTSRMWGEVLRRSRRAPTHEQPAIEDGALVLVRFYMTAEELLRGDSVEDVHSSLDSLARRLRSRLKAHASAVSVVKHLSNLLFMEDGFAVANMKHDYDDYRNLLLNRVLSRRMGLPISLAVLFAAICARVGVQMHMIGLPGHQVLLAVHPSGGGHQVFVDIHRGGQLLTLKHCQALLWNEEMARPLLHGDIWLRMMHSLIRCHTHNGEIEQCQQSLQLLRWESGPIVLTVPYPMPQPQDDDAVLRELASMGADVIYLGLKKAR